ncbi:flagellar hook-length control protein FliK [Dinoroseobacter sp. S76]|uniref:flagellar hook-length control protein FliK n=1 Tax=Dinoroseobacter sp. S76 TaxID=3415124 RepID=UPI003C7B9B7B
MHLEITRVLPALTASDSQTKASAKGSGGAQIAGDEASANGFLEAFQAEENRNRKPEATPTSISEGDETPEKPSAGGEASEGGATAETDVDGKAEIETDPRKVDVPVKEAASVAESEGKAPARLGAFSEDRITSTSEAPVPSQAVEKAVTTTKANETRPTQAAPISGREGKPSAFPSPTAQELNSEASAKTRLPQDGENASLVQTDAGAQEPLKRASSKEAENAQKSDSQRIRDEVNAKSSDRAVAAPGAAQTEATPSKGSVLDQLVEPDFAQSRPRPIVTLSEAAFSAQTRQVNIAQSAFSDSGSASRTTQTANAPSFSGTGLSSPSTQAPAPKAGIKLASTQPESNRSGAAFAPATTQIEPTGAVLTSSKPVGVPQAADQLLTQFDNSRPASPQGEGQGNQQFLAKRPLDASMPPRTLGLAGLAPIRAEIRQIASAAPDSSNVLIPPKQESIGPVASPATAEITVSKGEATNPGSGANAPIGAVTATPTQLRPFAMVETKTVDTNHHVAEKLTDANSPERPERAASGFLGNQQTPSLGHSTQNAALSMQAGLSTTAIPTLPVKTDTLDMFDELTLGASNSSSESTLSKADLTAATAQRPATTAQAILAQLQAGMPKAPGDSTEILLSPEELGRVRMTLSGSEGVGTVLVQVERPETLDLIRRNIEQMRAELAEAGWENVSFSFSQDGSNASDSSGEREGAASHHVISSQTDSTEAAGPASPRTNTSSSGLDLRL